MLLQWADFAIDHAEPILAEFRDRLLTVNDDIQGTAPVVLATVLSARGISGLPVHQQRIVLLGGPRSGAARVRPTAGRRHGVGPGPGWRRRPRVGGNRLAVCAGDRVRRPGRDLAGHNAFIFPAVGLAVIAAGATRMTETMLAAAAAALARLAGAGRPVGAGLLPPVDDLADLAPRIALAIAVRAVADGVAPPRNPRELADRIAQVRWRPRHQRVPDAGDDAGVESDGDRPDRVIA